MATLDFKVVKKGDGASPCDLSTCSVHYKMTQTTSKGNRIKGSSRHAKEVVKKHWIMEPCVLFDVKRAEYKFITVTNTASMPARFVLGEGEVPECLEYATKQLAAGGSGILKLKAGELADGRPEGALTVEVDLLKWSEPCQGPATPGWDGMKSAVAARAAGEKFLQVAEAAAGSFAVVRPFVPEIEADIAFTLKKMPTKGPAAIKDQDALKETSKTLKEEQDAKRTDASVARSSAARAARHFRRVAKWLESSTLDGASHERARALAGLARALLVSGRDFTSGTMVGDANNIIAQQAKSLALKACDLNGQDADAKAAAALALHALGDLSQARDYAAKAQALQPTNVGARNALASIAVSEAAKFEKSFMDDAQKLSDSAKKGDPAAVKTELAKVKQLFADGKVPWSACVASKVGKTIGELRSKPPKGDASAKAAAQEAYCALIAFTDKRCRQAV